jgi:hypothetical protein
MDNMLQWTLRHGSHRRIEAWLAITIASRRTATWKGTCELVVAQVVGGNLADPRMHRSVEGVVVEIPTRAQTRHVSKRNARHLRLQNIAKTTVRSVQLPQSLHSQAADRIRNGASQLIDGEIPTNV